MTALCCLSVALLAPAAPPAAADVRPFKLATGELLAHAFKDGVPLPAGSKWVVCTGAGPAIVPEDQGYRLNWVVHLKARGPLARLGDISRVTLQEVSGKTAVQLFDGRPEVKDDRLLILAPAQIVSREHYPWLYSSEATLLVLRATLHGAAGEQDLLVQPVLIGSESKQTLRASGYVR